MSSVIGSFLLEEEPIIALTLLILVHALLLHLVFRVASQVTSPNNTSLSLLQLHLSHGTRLSDIEVDSNSKQSMNWLLDSHLDLDAFLGPRQYWVVRVSLVASSTRRISDLGLLGNYLQ